MFGRLEVLARRRTFNRVYVLIAFACAAHGANAAANELVHLPLDEGSGFVATDISGRGNHGSIAGGAAYDTDTADGSGFALRLDGSNDYIDLGAINVAGTGLTLAARFKVVGYTSSYRDGRLISKATGTNDWDHVFMLSTIASGSRTRLRVRVRVGNTTQTFIAPSGNIAKAVWYHAAATYDGTNVRLYLNGTQVGAFPLTGTIARTAAGVAIGSQPPGGGGKRFKGLIDDVRILENALSAAEIQAIANTTGSPSGSAPLAHDDSYNVVAGQTLSVPAASGLLQNDSDADGDTLQAVLQSTAQKGTLTLNANGSFQYTPHAGVASDSDTFGYQAYDGEAFSTTATVFLTIEPSEEPPPTNEPPTISGTPATSVQVSQSYRFVPTASDPNDDPLTFSITNRPAWASFSTTTGELNGLPSASHVGTYSNITIGVSDGTESSQLPPFSITVKPAATFSTTLHWLPPTLRVDDTPLSNLAGFRVFWGSQPGAYSNSAVINNAGVTSHLIQNLSSGRWYFSVKAFDADGRESAYAAEVSRTFE